MFDIDEGDEAWLKKLKANGFSNEDIDAIVSHVKSCADWEVNADGNICDDDESIGLSRNLTEQFFKNTWASQEGIPHVLLTSQGSLAGTPFADLVYTFAMARVLSCLQG